MSYCLSCYDCFNHGRVNSRKQARLQSDILLDCTGLVFDRVFLVHFVLNNRIRLGALREQVHSGTRHVHHLPFDELKQTTAQDMQGQIQHASR